MKYITFLILISLSVESFSINKKSASDTTNNSQISYDPIISAIDSFMMIRSSETSNLSLSAKNASVYNFAIDSIPLYNDLIYEYRMAQLNVKSPISLEYNDAVKGYIDMYTQRRRDQVARMAGLSELYFPLFEEKLDKYNLPLELKYLAIVESALNPNAKSKSGAVGLWQFMFNSASMFDLKIDSYIDERSDPFKSTEAACKYLEYLYRIFNDWHLALAAYNGGPGIVRNAIARSGGKTSFWEIRPFLPKETQGYVPAFIAANYVMNFSAEHNIFPIQPKILYNQTDTVIVKQSLYFKQISSVLGIPEDLIKFLNPIYKQNFVPYNENHMTLILPVDKVADFIKNEHAIYNASVVKDDYNSLKANAAATDNKLSIIHTVKKGEYFHKLAIRYRCTIDNIIAWNNLTTYSLNEGQKLVLWIDPSYDVELDATDIKQQSFFYYTVQFGDTFQSIADKFQIPNYEKIKTENNNVNQEALLTPGSKIKIPN